MNRLLTVIKFNSRTYPFAANFSKKASDIQKLNEFPAAEIENTIQRIPALRNFTEDQWKKTFETFIDQGLHASSFLRIIARRPQLLRRSADNLVESFECLRETQFGDANIFELIERHPELLEYTDRNGLRKKLAFLKPYAKTDKNIYRLFLASPNIITDSNNITEKKFEYLTDVMKVDETDIAKSNVFSYTLDAIKCRHVFLTRLGLFKPKNPKVDKLQPSKNPKMTYIFDTSDREFAVRTCQVTLEEFETFRELYKRERHRKEDNANDEDDADEEEDVDIDDIDQFNK